jgi:hypothetical protein
MSTEVETLKKALRWALRQGVNVHDLGDEQPHKFEDAGCGCCGCNVDVPEDIADIVNECALDVIAEWRKQ